ncbi:MAG: DUF5777 family beta-barrel protein [Candidatus Latescibacterota bacterium]
MKPCTALCAALLLVPSLARPQPTWQAAPGRPAALDLLHEVMTPNFPTSTTLASGDFHFEISHRFHPPLEEGYDANFGLDGPVNMRIALGYGVSDRLLVTLGRSNLQDNLDLQVRYRLLDLPHPVFPGALGVQAGVAWNTQEARWSRGDSVVVRKRLDADNFQYYAQLIGNVLLLDGRLGIGVVPSYLYNSTTFSVDRQYTCSLGNYYRYYFNDMWGAWLEYNPVVSGWQGSIENGVTARSHDSLALGLSIETGGHFFYLFTTNNTRLNPSQYLVGADADASPDNWRLAFGITRHL